MKRKIVLTIFLYSLGNFCFAQETKKTWKSEFGAAAGFTTGYGISYRGYYEKIGFQATFFPYKSSTFSNFSTGFTLLYKLIQKEKTNFYLYQGNHYFYSRDSYLATNQQGNPGPDIVNTNEYYNVGIGAGIEIVTLKNIGFNFMGGIAGYDSFEFITLTGEFGVFYKF